MKEEVFEYSTWEDVELLLDSVMYDHSKGTIIIEFNYLTPGVSLYKVTFTSG